MLSALLGSAMLLPPLLPSFVGGRSTAPTSGRRTRCGLWPCTDCCMHKEDRGCGSWSGASDARGARDFRRRRSRPWQRSEDWAHAWQEGGGHGELLSFTLCSNLRRARHLAHLLDGRLVNSLVLGHLAVERGLACLESSRSGRERVAGVGRRRRVLPPGDARRPDRRISLLMCRFPVCSNCAGHRGAPGGRGAATPSRRPGSGRRAARARFRALLASEIRRY